MVYPEWLGADVAESFADVMIAAATRVIARVGEVEINLVPLNCQQLT